MKRLQRRGRVAKSELRQPALSGPWYVGAALLISLTVGVRGLDVRGQERPSPRPARPATPAPPVLQTLEGAEDYRYDVDGRRDPLEPLVKEVPPEALRPKPRAPERPPEPLERFDLAALKLVGIVWGNLGRKALIKAPDGKSYFATLETYMGKYSGKVIAIEDDHLVIEEQYLNAEDKLVPKTLTIPLRRKDKKEG